MFYHCLWILCTGILISPINAGFSFGGTYCALSTCEGSGQTWCDSGCCTEHGVTHCCPNLMMVIVGSVFGTLLVLLVALTLIVIYLRRRRSLKLHAISREEPPVVRITRTGHFDQSHDPIKMTSAML
ncbi:uncharacterized protein [Argopecten irradians]|uniref:uncharacterized protein isoform X2 n=1 Tax=Argopecten irradians TaxID=31199 RepID=UPI003713E16D